ncbi:MAG: hypothetical protein CVU40_14290 [Chloroflexi bacterium HGW-Chloroflexi-2]|nr:MAG: hypothetical protein CVU40_14290 [Chloroflexi bacterium HGW-Chloroflexi-2]
MNIDILTMGKFAPNEKAINVALPVLAIECEATPPLENYLDVYEETVLKLVSIGLSTHGIAVTLNATETLIEEILAHLEMKKYVEKEIGKPWNLTDDGNKYLDGSISERESTNSLFGYMFINVIKKDMLPFFYQGDINKISLFRGERLPAKLTISGDEPKTFEEFPPKRSTLREAYKCYIKNADTSKEYDEGEISHDEAVDLFEDLDAFDEVENVTPLESLESDALKEHHCNMFIRALNCPPKRIYLTMRIIIDPQFPGGYRAESPFDFNGIDNNYFLRQTQWLAATGTTFIGEEELNSYLIREIKKISPSYKSSEKDFSVFLLEKTPLLKLYETKFPMVYGDMSRIYSLMQRQSSLLEKENIVNNISRSVVERLFNAFFRGLKQEMLFTVSRNAKSNLNNYGCKSFIQQLTQNTEIDPFKITWSHKFVCDALGRLGRTHGNSIVEKFINIAVVDYYFGTKESRKLLSNTKIQSLYELADQLNQIRRKVSHDTDERFGLRDYEFYMANVFELINGLLEAFREE